jgi:oligopeptidase B
MRPELFAGIVARVPYVDILNTLLDPDLLLATIEVPEFGDPARDLSAYRTIAGYSPYDNVKAQPYPPMLVTAGLSDARTQFWEPAKWVARLRAMKTNDARIALRTHMSAGHSGAAGRFAALEEAAMLQAFALDVVGMR